MIKIVTLLGSVGLARHLEHLSDTSHLCISNYKLQTIYYSSVISAGSGHLNCMKP